MKILLCCLITNGYAQVAEVTHKPVPLKVAAGPIYCTFTNQKPEALTGLHIECVSPSASLKQDTVITTAPSLGHSGQFTADGSMITWSFQRGADRRGGLLYKVVANGKTESGSL